MLRYVARRLVAMVIVLIIVSFVAFALIMVLPGDPAQMMLGEQVANDNSAYLALRQQLGLDRPIPIQYLDWATNALRGNFGISLKDHLPIGDEIAAHVFPTVELAILAMLIALAVAIPAGIVSALKPNSTLDVLVTLGGLSGVAFPHFFLGILLIYAFAVALHVLAPSGYVAPWEDLGQNLKLMLMPALALSSGIAAVIMRQVRASLLEVLQQEYVIVARAKGLGEQAVVSAHALKNALIPVVVVIGLQAGTLIGGAVVIETVFAIPGMGRLIVDSMYFRDYPMVQALLLLLAVVVLVTNLLTDLSYAYLDPRIRLGERT
ncbi:MAG: ABC transporter permease [Chloroflexi bacterium]|nr:ABC transporter permease [Chloroflexota bacterium]